MPDYYICCSDGTDRECQEHVRVRLDIVGLTEDQIDAIEQGQAFPLSPQQIADSGIELDAERQQQLDEQGWISWRVDIDAVCDPCGVEAD